ncbi:hypothetical protein GIB67_011998 [Kingdonia uniflora]|uniref:Uncharacterized protein n=1 Tax=Kingdonia uniflora TaxID=39325 RepID=A0A7J7M031_9MAGN|nr:hypothetical protein GIB67_011998 [Kingdonia uniflora]
MGRGSFPGGVVVESSEDESGDSFDEEKCVGTNSLSRVMDSVVGLSEVVVKKDDVSVLESGNRILRSTDEREVNRIKPNPTVSLQPVFVDPGPVRNPVKGKSQNKPHTNGLCLEISGRVQHDRSELQQQVMAEDRQHKSAFDVGFQQEHADEEYECSLDCN